MLHSKIRWVGHQDGHLVIVVDAILLPMNKRRARRNVEGDAALQSVARAGRSQVLIRIVRAAFAIALVTGPAGSAATPACGGAIAKIMDPGLRASFEKFEAQQSQTASKVCASFHNAGI